MQPSTAQPTMQRWADGAVVYHIYPRSFQDSNSDGIGDLPGITSRLGYLKGLGVTAIWLSPFYTSPQADFGYDIADYCGVSPEYGTIEDFLTLLHEAHALGLRVMVDLVPNHTSDEHAWFVESSTSRTNSKADWYIWHDGHESASGERTLPNNWRNVLTGETAWDWCEARRQYYLHSFHRKQPDLNWQNLEVRQAIHAVMRFWLDIGVDGFRVDAVYWLAKDGAFTDDPLNPDYQEGLNHPYRSLLHVYSCRQPALFGYLAEMAAVLREPAYASRNPFMVLEAYPENNDPTAEYIHFYAAIDSQVAAPFNFGGINLAWDATAWSQYLQAFYQELVQVGANCIASFAFGNHDTSRLATRLGEPAARAAAVLQLTLPGMSFIYYGEELGMQDVPIPPEQAHDPAQQGDPQGRSGRDPERSPMQWSPVEHAGFTEGPQPWLPLAADYAQRNTETQAADSASFLTLYRTLLRLRAETPALQRGHLTIHQTTSDTVLCYTIHLARSTFAVVINFSGAQQWYRPDTLVLQELIVSSDPERQIAAAGDHPVYLAPYEAILFAAA